MLALALASSLEGFDVLALASSREGLMCWRWPRLVRALMCG